MFEISGDDIMHLGDGELRTLVARLAIAELRSCGFPISGVTAGGDQDAPDGGIDVRAELPHPGFSGDFLQRLPIGFQVKKPDMSPAAILNEMRPGGVLRPAIGRLADAGGSYVIVSAQGSVADRPLLDRRTAMTDAVADHPAAARLLVDFYDRTRLATWVNKFPGAASWVRSKIGRPLAGWQAVGAWSGTQVSGEGGFISDAAACLRDARTKDGRTLTLAEGVECLRDILRQEGQCIRLIGLSGLGKTRLVQALFESDIASDPLDPSFAIYTDYSETPTPTARQLAAQLIETGQRAILVVDNCNPQTHSELARLCRGEGSKLSLITVEYDVRDDEPEGTEVFRLEPGSEAAVRAWLQIAFPLVSQMDRHRIAEFSDGNFRVARVLADTIKKGDSLGDLRDRDLFRRIFDQRNDPSDELVEAAEILSLVYSFNRLDTEPSGELALLASMTDLPVTRLYAFVARLKQRSIVQTRGKWGALLPHAIANRLSAQALERIPPSQLDHFCSHLPHRMKISFSRRLGYLHGVREAQAAVGRCLSPNGPLGDLLAPTETAAQMLRNLAPVAPEATLRRICAEIGGHGGADFIAPRSSHRWQIVILLKALAYSPELFEPAVGALAAMVCAEAPDENHNSARDPFEELFHIQLSGTQADPQLRRTLIRQFYEKGDADGIRCGHLGLRGLLEAVHFTSTSNFDFGARSRNFGWQPLTDDDAWTWFTEALGLAADMAVIPIARPEIRRIVARSLRGILSMDACLDALEIAARTFVADGEWIDGWKALRGAMRFDGEQWSEAKRERICAIEEILRPVDLLGWARAYVIDGSGVGVDLIDIEGDVADHAAVFQRLNDKAEEIGFELAGDAELLGPFLREVMSVQSPLRAHQFGIGLARSGPRAAMWEELVRVFKTVPEGQRNSALLGGFLWHGHRSDPLLADEWLDAALVDRDLSAHFVYLQAQTEMDAPAIARFRKGLALQTIAPSEFYILTHSALACVAPQAFTEFLQELADLPGGAEPALDVFQTALHRLRSEGASPDAALLDACFHLLPRLDYRRMHNMRVHRVQEAICYCLESERGDAMARELCASLKAKIAAQETFPHYLDGVFRAIFVAQPLAALDELVLAPAIAGDEEIGEGLRFRGQSPLEVIDADLLWDWADADPALRYRILARSLNVFAVRSGSNDAGLCPLFLGALERAPDRGAFLERVCRDLRPYSWNGDLSYHFDRRADHLHGLAQHQDGAVRQWAQAVIASLRQDARYEREQEAGREEAFE